MMKDVAGITSRLTGPARRRYEPGAQWFHWVTAVLMFTIIPIGWIYGEFKTKGDPPTGFEGPFPGPWLAYGSVHKTLGLILLATVVARIVYRIFNPPPPLPGSMGDIERRLAHASHWLLYAVLLVMPISGYVMSSAGHHPLTIFGLFDFPKLPIPTAVGDDAKVVHRVTQWAVYALILLHIAATGWHAFLRRDAVLDRMLPRQTPAE